MIDGETGCSSSKIAIETNKQLFHVEDSSATYARKIDLILRYNDRKNVDLCSNEWKRSKVTPELKLKQQSKNLCINASIMNSLHAFGTSPSSLLAIDMIGDDIVINRSGKLLTKSYSIGLHGYIYLLTKVDDYFVAAPHSILVIPRRFSDIACIENTLLALFRFKHFYTSLIPALRKRIAANERLQ
ncbi:uncharacterized protein RHIMIDRAFT_95353 [Rhizopus microsporus ATCC 52813]|uniref:Uncharacterized protein n=1 Tax=Rhizopus microsporus ATCC 52813 TaxID=1340429 RepID=A0A2G4SFX6_RHIZD|nr:uncharacterized protein RHIMIDRAFT_95353 [Rhizopus microsporus ATCC 52813]PHZ07673.1 hypothetical protein RHIMIDRAFT_95353 [Rhizopus microsporus ATCC 52813]